MTRLPEFLGIGAEKCATTWLHNTLIAHPALFLPGMKETQFFNRYYERGVEWYARHFDRVAPGQLAGEVCPQYFHTHGCAERIRNVLSDVRLILLLRNPIDRAYSQYWMDVAAKEASGGTMQSFSEAIESNPDYLRKGLYHDQVVPFLDRYPRERLLVLLQENVRIDPDASIRSVYEFLNVDPSFTPPCIREQANRAAVYRGRRVFRSIQKTTRLVEALGGERLTNWARNNGIRDRLLQTLRKPIEYPEMHPAVRGKLKKYYQEPNRRLAELLNIDLSIWD